MKTYCQPVFVSPFGHVNQRRRSISVVGFHVGFTFAHIPPTVLISPTACTTMLMEEYNNDGISFQLQLILKIANNCE